MLQKSNRELWLAFIAIVIITLVYVFMVSLLNGFPPASDFFGHSIGILGFFLMLMTETLYSLRKRSRSARWGRMSSWLDFHIFTGLVGPYMVLLHTSWKFNGLAGIVVLLTVIIVASGFIGRYIYTAVPRTADGVVLEAGALERQIAQFDAQLQVRLKDQPKQTRILVQRKTTPTKHTDSSLSLLFERTFDDWAYRLQWWFDKQRLDPETRQQVSQLEILLRQRRTLNRQLNSLALARRTLALWHAVHIPIGMALFTAAFIHIIAAIYYATLLR
jgi:hypothetical protein